WLLFRTRWGLYVRAVGESPSAVFAAGRSPAALQYQALLAGGVLGGLGVKIRFSFKISSGAKE
ncbi:MAG: ABC transporter permease subunit, partial [Dehalococcoidales bacterium]